jgi:hypothetical protein
MECLFDVKGFQDSKGRFHIEELCVAEKNSPWNNCYYVFHRERLDRQSKIAMNRIRRTPKIRPNSIYNRELLTERLKKHFPKWGECVFYVPGNELKVKLLKSEFPEFKFVGQESPTTLIFMP